MLILEWFYWTKKVKVKVHFYFRLFPVRPVWRFQLSLQFFVEKLQDKNFKQNFKGVESNFCRYMYTGSQNVGNRTMLKPFD